MGGPLGDARGVGRSSQIPESVGIDHDRFSTIRRLLCASSRVGASCARGRSPRIERLEVRRKASRPLRTDQRQRHAREGERTGIDEVTILESRIELALPAEEPLEIVEARQVAAQEYARARELL